MDAYKRVIDLLTDLRSEIDFRALGIHLAKTDPETFLRLLRDLKADEIGDNDQWMAGVAVDLLSDTNIVPAIKRLRNELNIGLKEAKDLADYGRFFIRGSSTDEEWAFAEMCRLIGLDPTDQSRVVVLLRKFVRILRNRQPF